MSCQVKKRQIVQRRVSWLVAVVMLAAVVSCLAPTLSLAADKKPNIRIGSSSMADPSAESMELFPAIEAGKVEVKLILMNSTKATVLIENKTQQPLNVRLPEAFVAVLAQQGQGGRDPFGGGQGGVGGQGGQQQGGFGGGQQGGGQGGQGFFNIPAERVGEVRVAGVCLEHGKEEPRPTTKYEIKPVEAFSKDPALYEMLKLFGEKKINQRVAQAAAWHIASKMSWEQLAAKTVTHIGQAPQPYFSQQELRAAMMLTEAAKTAAAEKQKQSPKPSGATAPTSPTASLNR
jgi:hypothetical protein